MLDAVIDFMPSPIDIPPVPGHRRRRQAGRRASADDDEPFSALAFKIMTDPFVGQLTFFRVYSGVLKSGDTVYNPIKRQEGAHRPHPADARQRARGDQGSARRRHRRRGGPEGRRPPATRCAIRTTIITLEKMVFPEPVISQAVEPKTKADQEKMGIALQPPGAGRSVVPRAHRRGIRPDHHLRHGRAAPRDHRRPHEARVRRRGQRRQAAGGLPRDDPQAGRRRRRQVRQAVGRPRPVRPRRG